MIDTSAGVEVNIVEVRENVNDDLWGELEERHESSKRWPNGDVGRLAAAITTLSLNREHVSRGLTHFVGTHLPPAKTTRNQGRQNYNDIEDMSRFTSRDSEMKKLPS